MASSAPETPIVSVIVPAWNVERWLDECLESVAGQTIGPDRLQLLVVDDGSTDSTLERARTFAADKPWVQVLTQPNSGGPGGPRNAGLDAASGRYVFFLDADDYLASEALERLVAMAERCSSDIVVARIIGIEGRLKPRTRHFDRDVDRASLYEVNHSGNVLKLFRRAFVEQHHLRLMPGVPGGEDGDFMQRAYLEAGVVSILGTYDAYFARLREGSQTTRRDRTDDLGEYIERIERERILPVVERVGPGAKRDALICGHMAAITRKVAVRWLALDPADRTRIFQVSSAIVRRGRRPGSSGDCRRVDDSACTASSTACSASSRTSRVRRPDRCTRRRSPRAAGSTRHSRISAMAAGSRTAASTSRPRCSSCRPSPGPPSSTGESSWRERLG